MGSGAVDLAVGGDQGGSIRIPASHCGIVGHKPTHGLVPYTGALGLEPGVDHLGPMARTVADAALLLDVLAGPDGLDPRQCPRPVADHRGALTGGASGLRVGVLAEGFGHDSSDPRVDELVRSQAARLADAGAAVVDISVPAHRQANGVLGAILGHGLLVGMFAGGALGTLGKGWYSASLAERWGESLASADLSPNALVLAVAAQLQLEADYGASYARARNAVPAVIAAFDRAFAEVDLLVLPTTGFVAARLPPPDADPVTSLLAAFSSGPNAAPFDVTGHPAISVPCGSVDEMPVGMMLVGRHFEDATVLRAAHAYEQL